MRVMKVRGVVTWHWDLCTQQEVQLLRWMDQLVLWNCLSLACIRINMPYLFDFDFFCFWVKDVGGREMRVRFSIEVNSKRRGFNKVNSSIKRILYYESSHKLYVGNLPKNIRPELLRDLFSRFGNIVSLRVLFDFKQGKNRAYAFLSFQSEAERDAAMSLNGTVKSSSTTLWFCFIFVTVCCLVWSFLQEFYGRTLIVKEGVERTEPLTEASLSA